RRLPDRRLVQRPLPDGELQLQRADVLSAARGHLDSGPRARRGRRQARGPRAVFMSAGAGPVPPGDAGERDAASTFFVFGLVVMAAWTLVIKYLAPVLYVVSERQAGRAPDGTPVMWDFWWVAHLILARLIWVRHPRARAAALGVCALE